MTDMDEICCDKIWVLFPTLTALGAIKRVLGYRRCQRRT